MGIPGWEGAGQRLRRHTCGPGTVCPGLLLGLRELCLQQPTPSILLRRDPQRDCHPAGYFTPVLTTAPRPDSGGSHKHKERKSQGEKTQNTGFRVSLITSSKAGIPAVVQQTRARLVSLRKAGLIPGLAPWVKDLAWLWLWWRL